MVNTFIRPGPGKGKNYRDLIYKKNERDWSICILGTVL